MRLFLQTVQTISLLAALFGKSGTGADVEELKRRKAIVRERLTKIQQERDEALRYGRVDMKNHDALGLPDLPLPDWCPVLIVAPSSVLRNWVDDFQTWAHFNVAVYSGKSREAALKSVEDGLTEVLVCGHSQIQDKSTFHSLSTAKVTWKVVIVDEFHYFKNETAIKTVNLRALRDHHHSVIIGLTGTVMQNEHKEL
jgi:SNF2 family DNA or RNA helicase